MAGVAGGFATEEAYRDVKEFFAKNKLAGAKRAMAETLEQIKSNAAWNKRDGDAIKEWFMSRHEKPLTLTLTTEALMTEIPE